MLDAVKLREDFPIFGQTFHGKPLAYLDSAASAQKPRQVLDAMTTFYETSYANVHRGVYELGERATAALEGARERVRGFVNAPSEREIIFVRNATEALNLVAYSYGLDNLGPGDVVLATELEHHSNFVPWQAIARRTGAEFAMIPVDDAGELQLDALAAFEARRVKVVALRPRLECARDDQRHPPARRLGPGAGRDLRRRRRAGRAPPHDRCSDAGRRLHRGLRAQAVRPERDRLPLGPQRASPLDVAVSLRRATR